MQPSFCGSPYVPVAFGEFRFSDHAMIRQIHQSWNGVCFHYLNFLRWFQPGLVFFHHVLKHLIYWSFRVWFQGFIWTPRYFSDSPLPIIWIGVPWRCADIMFVLVAVGPHRDAMTLRWVYCLLSAQSSHRIFQLLQGSWPYQPKNQYQIICECQGCHVRPCRCETHSSFLQDLE